MLKRRVLNTIEFLRKQKNPVLGDVLSMEIGISSRTLRNDIVETRDILEKYGMHIETVHKRGYVLRVESESLYTDFMIEQINNYTDDTLIPQDIDSRVQFIIKRLLTATHPIKTEDFMDTLYISKTTLNNDLKLVREELSFFNLDLESKPFSGTTLIGNEKDIRACIVLYFKDLAHTPRFDTDSETIRDILLTNLKKYNFHLTSIGFDNLAIHIQIALGRFEQAPILIDTDKYKSITETEAYTLSKAISHDIEVEFDTNVPESERIYITMHLMGKEASHYLTPDSISSEDAKIVNGMFDQILEHFKIDFKQDLDLYTSLLLHFQPMRERLKYNLRIENPLLEETKQNQAQAFEIAVFGADYLSKKWQTQISEEEIGYIALHFALALDHYYSDERKKDVLIVCASGVGSSQILAYNVKKRFANSLNSLNVSELYVLDTETLDRYDLIITTIPIDIQTQTKIVNVNYFLDDSNISDITSALNVSSNLDFVDSYFNESLFFKNLTHDTREAVLKDMIHRIGKIVPLNETFETSVFKREQLASTDYGNLIALPHPMTPMAKRSFVAIGILDKPIKWSKNMVKYVLLIGISDSDEDARISFNEVMATLTSHPSALLEFEKDMSLDNFKSIIKELISEEETGDDVFR